MRGGIGHRSVPPRRRGLAITLGLVLGLGSALAACSSHSQSDISGEPASQAPVAAMLAATRISAAGKITGSLVDGRKTPVATLDGVWSHDYTGTGDVTMHLSDAPRTEVELRWRDRELFVRRAVGARADPALALLFRVASQRPWSKYQLVGDGSADTTMAAFDPISLLELLQRADTSLSKVATTTVAGAQAVQWTTLGPVAVGLWPSATVQLWADSGDRVVRVSVSSPTGSLQYDVHDYGTTVNVDAPASADIDSGAVAPNHAVGAYVAARSGTYAGVAWSLERAPGTGGSTCWRWDATPVLAQTNRSGGECVADPPPSAPPEDQIEFVADGDGTGSYDALALTLPDDAKTVLLGFVGGRTTAMPAVSPFVWVGPTTPTIAFARISLADGSAIDCGAGAVTSIDDLHDSRATTNAAAAPWGCLVSP